jgi:hypothetical protein
LQLHVREIHAQVLKQEASGRVMQPHLRAMRDAISMQSACNHHVIRMQSASQRGGERPRGACDEGRNQHAINMQSTCNQHAISMQSACNQPTSASPSGSARLRYASTR